MLTPALAELARRERYLALELDGTRFNIGVKYGMLMAQLALALSGSDREEILAKLLELDRQGHMADDLVTIIITRDPAVRNRSLDGFCRAAGAEDLLRAAASLDAFRRTSENLYERVRATFFPAPFIAITCRRSCRPLPAAPSPTRVIFTS